MQARLLEGIMNGRNTAKYPHPASKDTLRAHPETDHEGLGSELVTTRRKAILSMNIG